MALTQLNAASAGISRLRTKGGPKPDTLYDLLNGYVDASGAISCRPGTEVTHRIPAGTIGMCTFSGGLVVFSHQVVGGMPPGVTCEVLIHPVNRSLRLLRIHFAGPFLGFLYVTAEFEDGSVHDYWLRRAAVWRANTVYLPNQLVQPLTANGFVYAPHRMGEPGTIWAPNVERAIGDVVEPTIFNGFEYVAIEVHGSPPRSGASEPAWPTAAGGIVMEEADVELTLAGNQVQPSGSTLPPYIADRYGANIREAGTNSSETA